MKSSVFLLINFFYPIHSQKKIHMPSCGSILSHMPWLQPVFQSYFAHPRQVPSDSRFRLELSPQYTHFCKIHFAPQTPSSQKHSPRPVHLNQWQSQTLLAIWLIMAKYLFQFVINNHDSPSWMRAFPLCSCRS